MRVPFIESLTPKERYSILYQYLIEDKKLLQIAEQYRGRCTMAHFNGVVSRNLLEDKDLLVAILKAKMPEKEYNEKFYTTDGCLGSRLEPYYSNFDESIFKEADYNSLSVYEKLIYNERV